MNKYKCQNQDQKSSLFIPINININLMVLNKTCSKTMSCLSQPLSGQGWAALVPIQCLQEDYKIKRVCLSSSLQPMA